MTAYGQVVPDKRPGDGQDGPDEPCWVSDDETFQILFKPVEKS